MIKIILLMVFILVTSVVRAWVDELLDVETSGLLTHRVASQVITLITGAGIWAIINLRGI
jgi:hypothetical protein